MQGTTEFLFEFLGCRLEAPQGSTQGFAQLRQTFRAENKQSDGGDHRHLWQTDAEDVHEDNRAGQETGISRSS